MVKFSTSGLSKQCSCMFREMRWNCTFGPTTKPRRKVSTGGWVGRQRIVLLCTLEIVGIKFLILFIMNQRVQQAEQWSFVSVVNEGDCHYVENLSMILTVMVKAQIEYWFDPCRSFITYIMMYKAHQDTIFIKINYGWGLRGAHLVRRAGSKPHVWGSETIVTV